jgi:hypothetical protein
MRYDFFRIIVTREVYETYTCLSLRLSLCQDMPSLMGRGHTQLIGEKGWKLFFYLLSQHRCRSG